jgi:RNA polymerase sigma factor (sigma-70 family)
MIDIEEAEELMKIFISLREKSNLSKNLADIKEFKAHEAICIEKFMYLVSMRTDKYRGFPNYDDLVQEGLEALIKAMINYNPSKGIWFWWAHKYIATRISRTANLHTTIRYPLKFAKENPPHKEPSLPLLIENRFCPDKNVEAAETIDAVKVAMKHLDNNQKAIINLSFGFDGDKPLSINKICKKMNISRMNCIKTINVAIDILKQNIKI